MENLTHFNTIIIGGGASGLISAIATYGKSVAIIESNSRVGKKLLSTGNGKCNLLNRKLDISNYNDSEFILPTFNRYGYIKINQFFDFLGLIMKEDTEGRVYPLSENASSVLDVLRLKVDSLGVNTILDTKVINIEKNQNRYVVFTNKKTYSCKNIIFATGSKAGRGIDSLDLVGKFASVVPFRSSLSSLLTETKNIKGLSGIRIKCTVDLISKNKVIATENGELLFKNYGVSGIAVFNLSAYYSRLAVDNDWHIKINFLSLNEPKVKAMLKNRLIQLKGVTVERFFVGLFSKMIAKSIIKYANLQLNSIVNECCLDNLVDAICNFRIKITGLNDFPMAQVCTGGVDLADVNSDTLELKKHKNFYVIGEVLNIDGLCGGFNLAWAWASGLRVGNLCKV